jgi:hypothetical protein
VTILLCLTLALWWPVSFAVEFFPALTSLGQRGLGGLLELLAHGAVAALAIAAVRALSNGLPSGLVLARAALVASPVATVQSLYWSVLPHQTMPDDKLPIAAAGVLVAAAWLVYLGRRAGVEP